MPEQSILVTNANTGLAAYIKDTVFKQMQDNRADLEATWNECHDNFQAVVQTNKWKTGEAEKKRSLSFVNATRQKVMAAYAILIDTLLTGGRVPYMLAPSPWDDVVIEDLPEDQQEAIQDGIEDMQSQINQQMRDCNADRALMKNVLSLCEYGEAYAKHGVITVARNGFQQVVQAPGTEISDFSRVNNVTFTFERQESYHDSPEWSHVSIWNMYRDMESDQTGHLTEGYGELQREFVSPYWLRSQKGKPLFIDDAIEEECQDGKDRVADSSGNPQTDTNTDALPPYLRDVKSRKRNIQYLEYWGRLPKEQVEKFEQWLTETYGGPGTDYEVPTMVFEENREEDGNEIEVMVCVAGSRVVRYARTTAAQRPFYRAVFEEDLDEQGGRGIAQNVMDMQGVLNGVFRSIEDNMKLSANVILGVVDHFIQGTLKKLTPGQIIHLDASCQDAKQAIQQVVIQNVTDELMKMFALCQNMLDEESMVPRTLQGIQVDKGKDTAYEIAQRVERAGKYLASVLRNIDEGLIEPIVTYFYEYNMMDPYLQKGKGNYIVKALGFTGYQDRIVRINKLQQLIGIALQHPKGEAEMAWRKIMVEITKALDMEPDQVLLDRAEKEEQAALQQPDPLTQAELAKKAAETDLAAARAENERAKPQIEAAKVELQRAGEIRKTEEHENNVALQSAGAMVPAVTPKEEGQAAA